jgi:hypothetical protein
VKSLEEQLGTPLPFDSLPPRRRPFVRRYVDPIGSGTALGRTV